MDIWTTPPTFASGQVVSASGHLQALTDNVNVLLGRYTSPQAPWSARTWDDEFAGYGLPESGYWRRVWSGYIRNKTDELRYAVEVGRDSVLNCKVRFTYGTNTDTNTVTAGTGTNTVSGVLNVTSYSGFYFVAIDAQVLNGATPVDTRGDTTVTPLYVYESDPQSYGSLHRFYTGDTPAYTDWQALSTRATTLYNQTGGVVIPFLGESARREWGNATTPMNISVYNGTIAHANRYLYYDLRVKSPELWPGGNDPNHGTLIALVKYNGTTLGGYGFGALNTGTSLPGTVVLKDGTYFYQGQTIKLQSGHLITLGTKSTHTFTGCTQISGGWRSAAVGDSVWHQALAQPESDAEEGFKRYVGTFDTTSLGLTDGVRYKVQVVAYDNIHTYGTNTTGMVRVMHLAEQPATNPTLAGWSTMQSWGHNDTVTGAGSVKAIRDNLAWLSSRISYANYATPQRRSFQPPVWFIREYDWLHYYCEFDENSEENEPQPSLGWLYGNKWEEASLPYEPNKWLSYDLRGVSHLWPGQKYRVRDVTYALEDSDS